MSSNPCRVYIDIGCQKVGFIDTSEKKIGWLYKYLRAKIVGYIDISEPK